MKKGIQAFAFGKGQKRGSRLLASTALTAAGLVAFASPALAVDDLATPIGENVVGGAATFDRPELGQLNIHQSTDRVIINWDSFNIGQGATTQFYQPGSGSLAVNRVMSAGTDPTQILGTLKANGRVMVLDRNGVFFGASSRLDVGGIIASTGDINDAAVMGGASKIELGNFGDGQIVNNGLISAADAGLVAFVGKNVANNGIINAKVGKVALAAGDTKATLDLYGDGLVEFAVDDAKGKVLASNSGTINAEGGTVAITANAAKDVVDNVINMDGIVNVSSVTVQGGKIILGGGKSGKVSVKGTLDASGKNGGGKIEVKGRDIEMGADSIAKADAIDSGNGGLIEAIADNVMTFEGSVLARGGAQSGNGGWIEVSGYEGLDFRGNADTTAANGAMGTLFLDPRFTIIHSGVFLPGIFQQYVISDDVLALQLRTNNVLLQADEFIDVGTRSGPYNLDISAVPGVNAALNAFLNALPDGDINLSTWNFFFASGTTAGSLTLKSDTVNFNRNLTMGNGNLTVDAPTLNMNSRIFAADGSTLLGDSRLIGTSVINTINVQSNAARINQAIAFSDDDAALTTINVDDGVYTENVVLDKSNVKLQSVNGRASTTIEGIGGVGALGAVLITAGVNDTQVGDIDKGFTIEGFDNGNPGIENAALYVQGAHSGLKVIGNEMIADGDEAMLTEYGFANVDMIIDNNKFSGKTYVGAVPNTGNQFVDPNVSRQLVALNLGHTNLTFTNNEIVGDAGYNQLVAIQSTGATVSGNDFDGNTTSASLRVRGSDIDVFGNTIDGNGGGYGIWAQNVAGLLIGENGANTIDNTGRNGIQIEGGSGVTKVNNNKVGVNGGVNNINGDAIFATAVYGIELKRNELANARNTGPNIGSGIHLQYLNNAVVGGTDPADANVIYDTGWDGVRLFGVSFSSVENNDIENVGRTGVYSGYGSFNKINDNKITTTGYYGVHYDGGGDAEIARNDIEGTDRDGIMMNDLGGVNLVEGNYVDVTGDDGIHAANVAGLTVTGNFIGTDGGNVNGDGIFGDFVSGAVIKKNEITGTLSPEWNRGSGVQIWNSSGIMVGGVDEADANNIYGTMWDGVRLVLTNGATVQNNDIRDVRRTGVYAGATSGTFILDNDILRAGRYGVNYDYGNNATISGNDIDDTGLHGINMRYVAGTANLVSGNHIDTVRGIDLVWGDTGGDGIHADTVSALTVDGNFIGLEGGAENIKGDGVFGIYVDGAVVKKNEITNTDSTEWNKGSGVQIQESASVTVGGPDESDANVIYDTGWDGVRLVGTSNSTVQSNDIDRVSRTGVFSGYGYNNQILTNDITGAGRYGINYDQGSMATISGNDIDNTGLHGIQLMNVSPSGAFTGGSVVSGNYIDTVLNSDPVWGGSGGDGIHAVNIFGLTISGNFIGLDGPIAQNGIFVDPSDDVQILDNQVNNLGENGIYSLNNDDAYIVRNNITNANWNGILVEGGHNVTIGDYEDEGGDNGNIVDNSGINGIEVDGTTGYVAIRNNTVTNSGANGADGTDGDGIQVHGAPEPEYYDRVIALLEEMGDTFVEIVGNTVTNSAEDGIDVHDIEGRVSIDGNVISRSGYNEASSSDARDYNGHDGIFVANVRAGAPEAAPVDDYYRAAVEPSGTYTVSITNNDVDTSEDDGIEVINSGRTLIQGNDVRDSGQNATYWELDGYGADGIHVRNVFDDTYEDVYDDEGPILYLAAFDLDPVTDSAVDILDNRVNVDRETGEFNGNSADDGIQVLYSGNTVIDSNHVANSGFVGEGSSEEPSESEMSARDYEGEGPIQNGDYWGADGIHVLMNGGRESAKVSILDMPYYGYGNSADITNNFVDNSADDGIDADYVNYLTVDANDVDVSGNQGIEIIGGGYGYPGTVIGGGEEEPESPGAELLGLFEKDMSAWTAIVTNNVVNNSERNGIKIENYDQIEASFNTVSNSGRSGLLVTGPYNGDVHVEGNTFTDNRIGATFRSGLIDLTGESNTFNGGRVGLRFSPLEYTDWQFVFDGESFSVIPVEMRSFLELVDDDAVGVDPASAEAPILNFGGTIGAQIFNNQSRYFVELRNGAFFNPGSPTWLNGTQSTYTMGGTTITPGTNLLSAEQWAFLEPMFRDWNDGIAVGRFWALEDAIEIDQQNVFDQFAPFAALGGQVNVVLLGLPRLAGGPAPGPTAFDPNAIEPQAGDDGQQTAGLTPEELNAIQTAAGDDTGSNSSCWMDATTAATGGATTFSFSSVIDQTTLAQETNCGSSQP